MTKLIVPPVPDIAQIPEVPKVPKTRKPKFVVHDKDDSVAIKMERTAKHYIEKFNPTIIHANETHDLINSRRVMIKDGNTRKYITHADFKIWIINNDPWAFSNKRSGQIFEIIIAKATKQITLEDYNKIKLDSLDCFGCKNGTFRITKNGFEKTNKIPLFTYPRKFDLSILKEENWNDNIIKFNSWVNCLTNNNPQRLQAFYEYYGYALIPRLPGWRKFFILKGFGFNGKSFWNEEIFPRITSHKYCVGFRVEELMVKKNNFATNNWQNKIFAYDDEMEVIVKGSLSLMKRLASSPFITIENKGKDKYEDVNTTTMYVSTNNEPTFNESGQQLYERIMIINFDYDFKKNYQNQINLSLFEDEKLLDYIFMKLLEAIGAAYIRGNLIDLPEKRKFLNFNDKLVNFVKTWIDEESVYVYNEAQKRNVEHEINLDFILQVRPKVLYNLFKQSHENSKMAKITFYNEIEKIFNVERVKNSHNDRDGRFTGWNLKDVDI